MRPSGTIMLCHQNPLRSPSPWLSYVAVKSARPTSTPAARPGSIPSRAGSAAVFGRLSPPQTKSKRPLRRDPRIWPAAGKAVPNQFCLPGGFQRCDHQNSYQKKKEGEGPFADPLSHCFLRAGEEEARLIDNPPSLDRVHHLRFTSKGGLCEAGPYPQPASE